MKKNFALLIVLLFLHCAAGAQTAELVGSWKSAGASLFSYKFRPGGGYEFVGYRETDVYGCKTTLLNEVTGSYSIADRTLTLSPSRDFWKSTNSCLEIGNKKQLRTPQPVVYEFRLKSDETGDRLLCLTGGKYENCFRREKE